MNSVGLFVSTGLIGVMQKIHQSGAYAEERNEFLTIAFCVALVASVMLAVVTIAVNYDGKKFIPLDGFNKKSLIIGALLLAAAGIGSYFNNRINLYLVGVTASATFFPLINGINATVNILCGVFLFKERFNVKTWISIALGIVAVGVVWGCRVK